MLPPTHLHSKARARHPDHMQATIGQFRPYATGSPARARGCYTCTHFHGIFYAEHLLCERNGGTLVIGAPRMGCAFWERERGADEG